MLKVVYILVIYFWHTSICQNDNGSRKYYFRLGKNSNEFKVNNRIYFLNHNITDYDYSHKPIDRKEVLNMSEKKVNLAFQNDTNVNYLLDEEWNFDHDQVTKRELPLFIHKLYEGQNDRASSTTTRILFNCNKNSSNRIISFNLQSLKPNETVIDAELYFFWPLEESSKMYKESVILRLYQFEKAANGIVNDSHLIENPDIHKLFNVIYISKAQRGWQTFKLKKPIDNWMSGEENLGLLLTISSYNSNKLLAIYYDTNQGIHSTFAIVTVQNNYDIVNMNNEIPDHNLQATSILCQRKQWNVNFKILHWDKFIITPDGFAAYDCIGKCIESQSDEVNHLKLLHTFHKRSPCCVPSRYLPLPIMFYDKFGNVVIKNYPNMIVKNCGCR